jgi:N-methylhydantoinase A
LADVSFERVGDLRYVGQGYELKIPIPAGTLTPAALDGVVAAFHRAHAAEYGHAFEQSAIEIVNVRVIGVGQMPKLTGLRPPKGGSLQEAYVRTASCTFRANGELKNFDTPVYQRAALPVGESFTGPAIILQKDSTTVVTPGASAIVHPSGSLIITLGGAS